MAVTASSLTLDFDCWYLICQSLHHDIVSCREDREVSRRALKSMSRVNQGLHEIAQSMLWQHPEINIKGLRTYAYRPLPPLSRRSPFSSKRMGPNGCSSTIPTYRFKTATLVAPSTESEEPRLFAYQALTDLASAPYLERIESRAPAHLMRFLSVCLRQRLDQNPFFLNVRILSIEQREYPLALLCPHLSYLCFHDMGVRGGSYPPSGIPQSRLVFPPLGGTLRNLTHLEIQAPWDLEWIRFIAGELRQVFKLSPASVIMERGVLFDDVLRTSAELEYAWGQLRTVTWLNACLGECDIPACRDRPLREWAQIRVANCNKAAMLVSKGLPPISSDMPPTLPRIHRIIWATAMSVLGDVRTPIRILRRGPFYVEFWTMTIEIICGVALFYYFDWNLILGGISGDTKPCQPQEGKGGHDCHGHGGIK